MRRLVEIEMMLTVAKHSRDEDAMSDKTPIPPINYTYILCQYHLGSGWMLVPEDPRGWRIYERNHNYLAERRP